MPIHENATIFFDGPVKDYSDPADWVGAETAYRLRIDRKTDPSQIVTNLECLSSHDDSPLLRSLVFGTWGGAANVSSSDLVRTMVRLEHRFNGLAALFVGDITPKETEISWIQNSDLGQLLRAFEKLEVLRTRGGRGLSFSRVAHPSLRALIVETGGLPRTAIRDLCRCEFPNLVHLELWLGARNYGWDGTLDDLQPILDGSRFPRLKHLGLRNSEIADDIADAVVQAPVLERLETLDLSYGNLSDRGGQSLWGLKWDSPLRQLILNHHYLSPQILATLQMELKCKVIAEDARSDSGEPRPIFVNV